MDPLRHSRPGIHGPTHRLDADQRGHGPRHPHVSRADRARRTLNVLAGASRMPAVSPSREQLERRLGRAMSQAIADYSMIEDGDRILVAVSGGKDSHTLLYLLRH